MKALTIKQPWADAITHGTKRTENRTWNTNYRGPLALHAGAGFDLVARFVIGKDQIAAWPGVRSAILAVATVTDCHHDQPGTGCCDPDWAQPRVYHWTLADIRPLAAPVPCPGRLGLWTPDADLLAAVQAQLEVTT